MKFLKKMFLCVLVLARVLAAQNAECDGAKLGQHEAYLLVDNLLSLSDKSSDHKAQLAQYKAWENLYKKFSSDGELNENEMKIYLFMVFIADEKTKVESQEEMAKGIEQKFVKQSSMMLAILKELPFLISSSCSALNNHFDLFSNKEKKQSFLTKYKNVITQSLGKEHATTCFDKLRN